jgi:acylphosphatase
MNENSREIKTVELTVRGRVQGVGFRIFVAMTADRLKISGWVKNLPDGSVKIRATAPRLVIDELITAIGVGPRGSRVEQVETRKQKPPGNLPGGFEIRQGFAIAEFRDGGDG